jgi:hypothetical protein
MGCGGPLAKRTAATPGPSTRGFGWTGHLFQGRVGAVVIDEPYLLAAARYIALNPAVAGLVSHAGDGPWSSARAHLAGEDEELATVAPPRALIPDFAALLAAPADPATTARPSGRRRSDDRWGRRNGLRRSSGGSAAPTHPANPDQSRVWTVSPSSSRGCCRSK